MKKYWHYIANSANYDCLDFIDKADNKLFLENFSGEKFAGKWSPLTLKYVDYTNKPHSDFPSLTGTVPIFSERALSVLLPLIDKDVEVLELNCLDREKSELSCFSNGAIKNVKNLTFKEDKTGNSHLFKISGWSVKTFVSDLFKETVLKHKLAGLRWKELS